MFVYPTRNCFSANVQFFLRSITILWRKLLCFLRPCISEPPHQFITGLTVTDRSFFLALERAVIGDIFDTTIHCSFVNYYSWLILLFLINIAEVAINTQLFINIAEVAINTQLFIWHKKKRERASYWDNTDYTLLSTHSKLFFFQKKKKIDLNVYSMQQSIWSMNLSSETAIDKDQETIRSMSNFLSSIYKNFL
jgi:hypothetical protein